MLFDRRPGTRNSQYAGVTERDLKCHQCDRPAFFRHGEGKAVPLCLTCSEKLQNILNAQFIQNAAMMNQALDEMDMVFGVPSMGGRIPVPELARAMQKGSIFNNINVTNSNVGVINTGDLAKIDAAITISKGSDAAILGQQMRQLTDAILASNDLDQKARSEIVEMLQAVSQQIVGERKKPIALALLTAIEDRAKGANAIIALVKSLAEGVSELFS